MALYISSIANAAILKGEVSVDAEHITLGDIFEGIEDQRNINYILGPSPKPGKNIVINAHSLQKLSKAFRLDWQPASNYEQVIVTRSATIVSAAEIRNAVNKALVEQGYDERYKVEVSNLIQDVILPGISDVQPRVEKVSVDNNSQFRATVLLPSTNEKPARVNVMGSLEYMVQIPVVTRKIGRDEVVRKSDIEMVLIAQNKITADMIIHADELIGKTPRRVLAPGQIAKLSDVDMPKIVKRGSKVTMKLNHNGMELITVGKALEDGAKGDIIPVVNLSSNRIIDTYVAADGSVTVMAQ
jgi:flagella basal body P-ring formation protein FlgA